MRDSGVEILVELVKLRTEDLRRPLDLSGVAPDLRAPLIEYTVLVREHVRLALPIPDRRVLRHDSERHLLSPAADQNWQRVTNRTGIQDCETMFDHWHVAIEVFQSRSGRTELVAIFL